MTLSFDLSQRLIISFLLMTLIFVLSACQSTVATPTLTPSPVPPTPTPTMVLPTLTPAPTLATGPEDVLGDWQGLWTLWFVRYRPDGTYYVAREQEDIEDRPLFTGEYRFEGTQLIIVDSEAAVECPNVAGIYEIELLEDGNLEYKVIEDECGLRSRGLPGLHRPVG